MITHQQTRELASLFAGFSDGLSEQQTGVAGLSCYKATESGQSMPSVYDPCLCLIVSGRKEIRAGDRLFSYGGGDLLVASIDMPVTGCVVEAGPQEPYLCIKIDLDRAILTELAAGLQAPGPDLPSPSGIVIGQAGEALADAVLRLSRLTQTPEDAATLGPLITREIHYRLLKSPQGHDIAALVIKGSMLQRLSASVLLIKENFNEALSVETLASAANMSISSFHHHFKALTGVSPIQYQKRLRLNEARRLMLADGVTASGAAFRVGYESAAQFSRDYARLFGAPPARDIRKMQAA
ncbi:AraC family transcriptional regulator [Aquisalinus flavus]|uniref:AraC family transcriptional regulator n=1 Tax=Aquisalinus flavus TaxID=1526572 RepID=A0A8J2V1D9_9PROT|nr:AraC family transcriptional regulator [Aquisalinus flavus]MBD0426943.1 AraC family transcriptional regulator [Aquisalinus flavus]UNE46784.1 AraC family transcriptional regulator [Aquisalinus flavus]GGC97142.1 AraC family transcriptional regulator [Aquisalinus flavus]